MFQYLNHQRFDISGTIHFPVQLSNGTVHAFEAVVEITAESSNLAHPIEIEVTLPSVNGGETISIYKDKRS